MGEDDDVSGEDEDMDMGDAVGMAGEMSDDEDDEEEIEDLVEEEDQLGEEGMDEAHDEMLQRFQDAKEDGDFPDEKDTPGDMTARVRFQRYRALESFRKSPWDPKESLPMDYSKIFQLHNLKRAKKLALLEHVKDSDEQGIALGQYVTLVLVDVPVAFVASCQTRTMPLICVGLHKHENKMSMVNFKLARAVDGYSEPVKSKEEIEFHVGFMRYTASALFSAEHRSSVNNKHKLERYWQPETGYYVASVGSEQVMSVNAERIVLKRLTLSGLPFRVHKRHAVVRFMFHNPADITWFKKAGLWTKHGRRGNIKESLGTHGYMKCVFNQPIQQHDTICMSLYKRVFPVWKSNLTQAIEF